MTAMISTRVHGLIDYGVAAMLGALARSGSVSPNTRRVLGSAGAYHAGYSAVTDYEVGFVPLVSMRQHLALDAVGAFGLCAAGLMMRREPPAARALMLAVGLAELAVVANSSRQPVRGPGQNSGILARALPWARTPVAYAPTNIPKPVGEGIWIVDGEPMHILGMPLPIRMTVIKLANGDLLLHSPTPFSLALQGRLERLGRIRHLLAPNIAHWTFLKDWQRHVPDASTWAAPGLRERAQVREAGVKVDHVLGEAAPAAWRGEITQISIPGGAGFREIALFHHDSRTAILTDLVLNLERHKLPPIMRSIVQAVGAMAPDGKAPIYLRALVSLKRRDAARAVERLLRLDPERVIFAHGKWFDRDGASALRRSLSWLGV